MAYGILVPWPGIEPMPLAVEAQTPVVSWITRPHSLTYSVQLHFAITISSPEKRTDSFS